MPGNSVNTLILSVGGTIEAGTRQADSFPGLSLPLHLFVFCIFQIVFYTFYKGSGFMHPPLSPRKRGEEMLRSFVNFPPFTGRAVNFCGRLSSRLRSMTGTPHVERSPDGLPGENLTALPFTGGLRGDCVRCCSCLFTC
ncbi:hypothetical protein U27_03180 [Candidatus Vecturithrix granuli]|uniref:Uncharacterized protein n=1 Tax=Vecturithrix granuli TaxID=1499967 RepID=A0A081BV63_VECG1|nr:hypothetical protein U27_03180 [Candidatus Vecturithrix granuli]